MSRIQDSVDDMRNLLREVFPDDENDAENLTSLLIDAIHFCNQTYGLSFPRCLRAAQSQAQKEVREQADRTPLPAK